MKNLILDALRRGGNPKEYNYRITYNDRMGPAVTHKCPGAGCEIQVDERRLACKPHWFSLPRAMRSRINGLARSRLPTADARWKEAVVQAIAWWNENPS